jgi:hypothetical protein
VRSTNVVNGISPDETTDYYRERDAVLRTVPEPDTAATEIRMRVHVIGRQLERERIIDHDVLFSSIKVVAGEHGDVLGRIRKAEGATGGNSDNNRSATVDLNLDLGSGQGPEYERRAQYP